jgi:hypothetical protein
MALPQLIRSSVVRASATKRPRGRRLRHPTRSQRPLSSLSDVSFGFGNGASLRRTLRLLPDSGSCAVAIRYAHVCSHCWHVLRLLKAERFIVKSLVEDIRHAASGRQAHIESSS